MFRFVKPDLRNSYFNKIFVDLHKGDRPMQWYGLKTWNCTNVPPFHFTCTSITNHLVIDAVMVCAVDKAYLNVNNGSNYFLLFINRGTAVAQWLRCCATNRKVAGSIPDGVNGIFHWLNPSDRTMAPGVESASNRNEYQEEFPGV